MCINREPCDACKELAKQGTILIEVRDGESGDNPARTGKMYVIKKDAAARLGMTAPIAFIERGLWARLTGKGGD